MRDDTFTTTAGVVNLHPTEGTHCVMFSDKFYFDSFGCPPPTNILNHMNNVFFQSIEFVFRKMIVVVQRIVCLLYLKIIIGFQKAVLIYNIKVYN